MQTLDPKALVNGVLIGRNAAKIFLNKVLQPNTFLWRPTPELSNLDDFLKSSEAWPINRVVFLEYTEIQMVQFAATPPAPMKKPQAPSFSSPEISQVISH